MTAKTMAELTAFLAQALGLGNLDPDGGMGRTRGWDSLAHVNLMLDLEQWAGVRIPAEMMGQLTTVTAIADHLRVEGVLAP